ncbi:MAG: GNAT family N-acetyltransferase [Candidatus Thorarchaeota archaeon]|nr:GNAT family N-acetyltransferase [Candidatus Thorarchaeota archaeon]
MEPDHQFVVEPANDLETYSGAWSTAMEHLYWYQESPVFDFNKNEEIDELRSDFGTPGNLFLVAHLQGKDEIVGVLGFRYRDVMARIRRWEPATIPQYRKTSVAKALLEHALEQLASMGVKRISYLMKHPFNSPECAVEYLNLYKAFDFEHNRPDSVDMVLALDELRIPSEALSGVQVETGENYTFEDLASITVKSFTSTPEEREIHGFDRTVTEHIQATALLQRMADGFYGYSSDEFRKIAVVDGAPAGFLGAFVSKSKYKPLTGVLGPMAVLPDYRRRGIALLLVNEVLRTLKEYGCEYAAVGTPAANTGAIAMYEKAGFKLSCRLFSLEREL